MTSLIKVSGCAFFLFTHLYFMNFKNVPPRDFAIQRFHCFNVQQNIFCLIPFHFPFSWCCMFLGIIIDLYVPRAACWELQWHSLRNKINSNFSLFLLNYYVLSVCIRTRIIQMWCITELKNFMLHKLIVIKLVLDRK